LSSAKPRSGDEAELSFPDFTSFNPGYLLLPFVGMQSLIVMVPVIHRWRFLTKVGV